MTRAARDVLLAALRALEPRDAAEAVDRERIAMLLREADEPFDRGHYLPGHLTASALVRHPGGSRVALLHHKKLGIWLQPGGHAQPGEEDPWLVALREAREEIGVDGACTAPGQLLDVDVHSIPAYGSEPAHEHCDLRVLVLVTREHLAGSAESHAVRWSTLAEAERLGCDAGLLRAIGKALAAP